MYSQTTPDVSVLLPVYNGARYLRLAIESILAQTLTNFELLVIDDGSSDESRDIAQGYVDEDGRVRVLSQANAGIVTALNWGLANARGEFVARMDSDDISLPMRLAQQLAYMRANPDVVLVGGKAQLIDAHGLRTGLPSNSSRYACTNLAIFPPQVLTAVHPLIMMRTEAIRKLGGYRSDFPHAEDHDLFMRMSRIGRVKHIPDVVLLYRIHGGNVSVQKLQEQERNAASAELANHCEFLDASDLRKPPLPSLRLFDAYVGMRVMRRRLTLHQPASFARVARMTSACVLEMPRNVRVAWRVLLRVWFHTFNAARSGLLTWRS